MDIDTLIREAELRVLAADRQWQQHGAELNVALRGHAVTASKVGLWGGIGVTVAAVATGLARWRSAARARREAKTVAGRAKGLARGIAEGVKTKWAGLSAAPQPAPAPATSSFWAAVVTTAGLLLGAAARSGLKTETRQGVTPLLFSVGLPMLTRWWRSRQPPRR